MPDLIAQGPSSENRWRRALPAVGSNKVIIGRAGSDWNVGWDSLISRRHVELRTIDEDRVEVSCISTARNPVFHRGRKTARFVLVPGEHFVVGRTTFTLANRPGTSESSAIAEVTEHAFDHLALRRRNFRDAASRIEMLARLPDLIASSTSDEELLVRVTSVLLQATPSASVVAIVASDESESTAGESESGASQPASIKILHYDSRIPGNKCPPVSARLVRSANSKRESVLHLWSDVPRDAVTYTISEDVDWAYCVPLRSEACPGWALYVSGQLACQSGFNLDQSIQAAPDNLEDDVKFAELVGTTLANLRQSSRLQRRQAAMQHFFAPIVMEALAAKNTDEVLAPREADLSVLFCDLRGFSQRSEQDADQLLKLLAQVSDALGVMTRHILDTGGVIGDFHGDAAMGFWGWPLEQSDSPLRAVEAAMKIRQASSRLPDQGGFRCGIGIASGRAVAGRIGTIDQVKVTAFGPVVNLASRLEGITKAFGVEIIIDEATALAMKGATNHESTDTGASELIRTRRLARVRPAGFQAAVDIFEVLPPLGKSEHSLTSEQILEYERSLDALISGDWEEAHQRLHALPPWDRPKDLLLATILRHNRMAPQNWTGVIDMPKS
jgi:adenylate cyclase